MVLIKRFGWFIFVVLLFIGLSYCVVLTPEQPMSQAGLYFTSLDGDLEKYLQTTLESCDQDEYIFDLSEIESYYISTDTPSRCQRPITFISTSQKTRFYPANENNYIFMVGENFKIDGILLRDAHTCLIAGPGLQVNNSIFYNCTIAIQGTSNTIIENSEFFGESDRPASDPSRYVLLPSSIPVDSNFTTKMIEICKDPVYSTIFEAPFESINCTFKKNYIHDLPIGISMTNIVDAEIHDNIFENIFYSAISDNSPYKGGAICNMKIFNNLFSNIYTNVLSFTNEARGDCAIDFNRNVVFGNITKSQALCGPFFISIDGIKTRVYHNLFYDSRHADNNIIKDIDFVNNIFIQTIGNNYLLNNIVITPENITDLGTIVWDPFVWSTNETCPQVKCEPKGFEIECLNPLILQGDIGFGPFQYPDYPSEPWPFNKTIILSSCPHCYIQSVDRNTPSTNGTTNNETVIPVPQNNTTNSTQPEPPSDDHIIIMIVEGNINTSLTIPYVINITLKGDLKIDGILSVPLGSFINVQGCADLRNTTFKSNYINNSIYDILKASQNCSDLNFKEIQINNLPQCSDTVPIITNGVFSISFEDHCAASSESGNGFEKIAHYVIPFSIFFVAIILAIGLYLSPLKEKIFPYRKHNKPHQRQFQEDIDGKFSELPEEN